MKTQKINLIKNILMLGLLFALLSSCAAKHVARQEEGLAIIPAKKPVSEFVRSDIVYAIDAYDPWEGFNRNMYVFNYYYIFFIANLILMVS